MPNVISNAIATVVRALGQHVAGIGRWLLGLFRSIADGINSLLSPVVDFFRGVGRAIQRVFDGTRDIVIKLLRTIRDARCSGGDILPEVE